MSVPHETTGRPATRTVPAEPADDVASRAPEPAAAEEAEAVEEQASEDVMRLLSEHVPLTLLADLAQPVGPDSPDILEDEGLPEVAWWEPTGDEQR